MKFVVNLLLALTLAAVSGSAFSEVSAVVIPFNPQRGFRRLNSFVPFSF